MKTYARIQNGVVAEMFKTDGDITKMFAPSLIWTDVSSQPGIREGWQFDGTAFTAPAPVSASVSVPTIAELQTQLAMLSARIASLAPQK